MATLTCAHKEVLHSGFIFKGDRIQQISVDVMTVGKKTPGDHRKQSNRHINTSVRQGAVCTEHEG